MRIFSLCYKHKHTIAFGALIDILLSHFLKEVRLFEFKKLIILFLLLKVFFIPIFEIIELFFLKDFIAQFIFNFQTFY